MKATERQVVYLMSLLGKSKYGNKHMNSLFKELGASMRERTGMVEDWVRNLSVDRASALITTLKG